MMSVTPWLILLLASALCAFHRTRIATWSLLAGAGLLAVTLVPQSVSWWSLVPAWTLWTAVTVLLNHRPLRVALVSQPFLKVYQRMLPQLSETERVALEAGTVGFEGELFSGAPKWKELLDQPAPKLSDEEQAFLDGPVEEACKMAHEWEISHERADLPPELWDYLKRQKFFGMIIPKSFGGLGFSAFAHSAVLQKVASVSGTLSATVAVPNSLGPAELLMHYGTEEQKNHYLPRLADGRELPCFGLTNPWAGSDATSIPDWGVVCKGQWEGKEVLGVRMNFDKRYITLAPVATIIGIAFRLSDPEHLLGEVEDIGITLALVPRGTPGMQIGRRHLPLNTPFQNGPIKGKDVFIPLSQLIGGQAYAGQGWRMLVECLSVGRSISLPSGAAGAVRIAALGTGAYARIRKQFGLAIGRFEGVEEALARIAGHTYQITAVSRATAAAVDRGEKPAVPSAIAKYWATELGRQVILDAMDVQAGKGVILGPRNFIGRMWQGAPVGITVEGANILTRSMIIFGQGATRCHPYVLKEMQAAAQDDPEKRVDLFDKALFGHIGFTLSNAVRSFWIGLTGGFIGRAPGDRYTRRFYRKLTRYSAALALVADMAMLTLGGKLKFKERLSARLGDVLSHLYIASAMLKRYEDQGRPTVDQPLLAWGIYDSVFRMQNALVGALRNLPNRPLAWLLGLLVFPLGQRERAPGDRTGHKAAQLLLCPNEARDRLAEFIYTTPDAHNVAGRMLAALPEVIAAEPLERKLEKARRAGQLKARDPLAQLDDALAAGVISADEKALLLRVREATLEAISVDDFDSSELEANVKSKRPPAPLRSVA